MVLSVIWYPIYTFGQLDFERPRYPLKMIEMLRKLRVIIWSAANLNLETKITLCEFFLMSHFSKLTFFIRKLMKNVTRLGLNSLNAILRFQASKDWLWMVIYAIFKTSFHFLLPKWLLQLDTDYIHICIEFSPNFPLGSFWLVISAKIVRSIFIFIWMLTIFG